MKLICWWFKKKIEFYPKHNVKTEITKGLSVKYKYHSFFWGSISPTLNLQIWVGENNHYQISRPAPMTTSKEPKSKFKIGLTRKKNIVSIELEDGWKQSYYLKTPSIWKLK